jgi:hypothetical protein
LPQCASNVSFRKHSPKGRFAVTESFSRAVKAMAKKWTHTACFQSFGTEPKNVQYSWSARSADGKTVVVTLWQDLFARKDGHLTYSRPETDRKDLGARPGFGELVRKFTICPGRCRALLAWASCSDPLQEGARAKALAPRTLRLGQEHIHSAASAAAAAGIPLSQFTSLASLLGRDTLRALLRHRWRQDGCTLSAYTQGIAVTLIAIAVEWVRLPADEIAALKSLRAKLGPGPGPSGLTEKNRSMLRKFDDPRLIIDLIRLPDKLWTAARRALPMSRRAFIDLQTALAIDLLIHVPMRMQNLACLNFRVHLHWPQGRRKPALEHRTLI